MRKNSRKIFFNITALRSRAITQGFLEVPFQETCKIKTGPLDVRVFTTIYFVSVLVKIGLRLMKVTVVMTRGMLYFTRYDKFYFSRFPV